MAKIIHNLVVTSIVYKEEVFSTTGFGISAREADISSVNWEDWSMFMSGSVER